ncbi:MAG: hypothetical protein ACWA5P_01770 [bacterium]
MNLFQEHNTAFQDNAQIRAIKKGISTRNTPFDRIRQRLIKELKK